MECEYCHTEMKAEGQGLVCPQCGNWLSALEVKYGREPPIENYDKKRYDWH